MPRALAVTTLLKKLQTIRRRLILFVLIKTGLKLKTSVYGLMELIMKIPNT
jgi:hypothetical protein